MDSTNNYILKLPKELINLLMTYLSKSWDIMQFLNAYPMLDYGITTIDLSCDYRFNLTRWTKFFEHDFTHIVSFNMNNTYWIPVDEIKRNIMLMPNLTQLLVMDTEFLADKEICLFLRKHCSKLETLAISIDHVNWNKITADDLPSHCKTVFFHIKKEWMSMAETIFIHNSFRTFKSILVFMDYHKYPEFSTRHRKFSSIACIPIVVKDCSRWEELLQNMLECDLEKYNRVPFGVSDIKKIWKNDYSLDNIKLQEFSCAYCASFVDCASFGHKLEYDFLCSQNTTHLRKLAINFCAVFRDIAESLFNKNLVYKTAPEDRVFQKIIKNCSLIEELEIWDCYVYSFSHYRWHLPYVIDDNPVVIKQFIEELNFITHLKHLRKLSLILVPTEIAKYDFLQKILKECNTLEYLSITMPCSYYDYIDIKHLFTSISQASQLKDLKIKYDNLSVDCLLEKLSSARSSKLQRLYLFTKKMNNPGPASVKNFLEKNPQLIFFGINNATLSIEQMTAIENIMNMYKTNKQKVFCMGTKWLDNSCTSEPNQKQMYSPSIHVQDLVRNDTRICVYNYFSDACSVKNTELFEQMK